MKAGLIKPADFMATLQTAKDSIANWGIAAKDWNTKYADSEARQKLGPDGKLITECINAGSFNFFPAKTSPIAHFTVDIMPWIQSGNCENDPSTQAERIEAYIQDLSLGFQSQLNTETRSWTRGDEYTLSDFDENAQNAIRFFYSVLFNEIFPAPLTSEKADKLYATEDSYWAWLDEAGVAFVANLHLVE